jgi:hypothetical protein
MNSFCFHLPILVSGVSMGTLGGSVIDAKLAVLDRRKATFEESLDLELSLTALKGVLTSTLSKSTSLSPV